jgi:hypothetical protein
MEKRIGRIDLGAQAEVASARRTDTPKEFWLVSLRAPVASM